MIEANQGNVPDELLKQIEEEFTETKMSIYTKELMELLDEAFKEVYIGKKGEVDASFNKTNHTNRTKWGVYVRKVGQVLSEYVTANEGKTPTGLVGKAVTLLTWSKNASSAPLPLMTESAILAMQTLFAKSPLAQIEVSRLVLKPRIIRI